MTDYSSLYPRVCIHDKGHNGVETLLIEIKEGRLNEKTLALLSGSDIQFHRHNRLDIALVKNFQIALIFLPAADIPVFVGEGRVDLGITGRDQVAEHEAGTPTTETTGVEEVMDLGFGRCKLQVQVPEHSDMTEPSQLVGKNVVTSFKNQTAEYFRDLEAKRNSATNGDQANGSGSTNEDQVNESGNTNGEQVDGSDNTNEDQVNESRKLRTRITYISGSVEAACALGVADGVVDLVGAYLAAIRLSSSFLKMHTNCSTESGETMRAAGLKPIGTVLDSTAVLIKSKHPSNPSLVDLIAKRIEGVIVAQRYVYCTYNIHRSNLNAARKITPGKRAPTVTSLEEKDWVAVDVMVPREEEGNVLDELSRNGAEDIIVTKIKNSRTS